MSAETPVVNSAYLDARVSVFLPGQLSAPAGEASLREIVEAMRAERYAADVARLRAQPDKEKRRELKATTLRAITLSGLFAVSESIAGKMPSKHSGLVQIDLDGVEDPAALRDALAQDPHVLFAHLSPSGNGVKAAVCVPADNDGHEGAFRVACAHIQERYGVMPDAQVGNANRLYYLSSDPDLKVNAEAVPLAVTAEPPAPAKPRATRKGGNTVAPAQAATGYAVEEVRRALAALPDRPDYDSWLKWANATRHAVGEPDALALLRERWPEEVAGEYEAKFTELGEVTAGTLFFEARSRGWVPEIYYENRSDRYFARDAEGAFRSYTVTHARGVLASYRTPKDETDAALHRIRHERCIDLALNIAGMARGIHDVNGLRVLVPVGPRYIEPCPGAWPVLRAIWRGMLGEEQLDWFVHWLGSSVRSYYGGVWQPSQVVAFIGPTASGKSLTQSVLTAVFGDRAVDVMQALTGGTEFNGDWAEATHLMVEDKFSENTRAVRERVKENVKAIAVNRLHRIHPKGKQALHVCPFWRMTISCNPTVGSLAVLPPLDDSVRNKISLLWTRRFPMPMPAETIEEKARLWATICKELPALIHDLLHQQGVPAHLRDPEGRFDVVAYHHPEAVNQHHRLTPEGELLENIVEALQEEGTTEFVGTARELLELLNLAGRGGYQTAKSLGRHLSSLAQSRPERVRFVRQSESHGNQYAVTTPLHELL